MRLLLAVLLTLVILGSAFGQTYTISTFTGGGLPVNIPGTAAALGTVTAVAVDGSGNVFFTVATYGAVLRLDARTAS